MLNRIICAYIDIIEFNGVKTLEILVWKQITFNSFKHDITTKFSAKWLMLFHDSY